MPGTSRDGRAQQPGQVVVIGSGWQFTSGISYYTCRLSNELASSSTVTTILMRALIPRRLYPGADRVGKHQPTLAYDARVKVLDGVDWWGRGLFNAVRTLWRAQPDLVVMQWWTGAVLHSYVVLAVAARLRGARLVLELHEVQDTGEAGLPLVRTYTRLALRPLLALVQGFVVHSNHDREVMQREYPLQGRPLVVAYHGPFDHHFVKDGAVPSVPARRDGSRRLLFFGTVRPYKGVEDLVQAFDLFSREEVDSLELAVVGETWESWTEPDARIAASPYRDRIHRVDSYVHDDQVAAWFASSDVVVLPYRRSSASGPLHIAMGTGLPVVVTRVGGLEEAARDYAGSTFVAPADPVALRDALRQVLAAEAAVVPHADPRSWADTVRALVRAAGMSDVA